MDKVDNKKITVTGICLAGVKSGKPVINRLWAVTVCVHKTKPVISLRCGGVQTKKEDS